MKKCLLLLFSFPTFLMAQSQTLFTYGKHAVTKKEFENAYHKNKSGATEQKTTVKEYLALYINFKLKVQAAKDLHLDTLPALQADLENFRSQIEAPFLKDDKVVNELVEEAFARSQKDIHLLDYFIALPAGADTTPYFQAANRLYQALSNHPNQKKETRSIGADSIKRDVGLITVFTLPYILENIIYSLKPGTYAKPVRVSNGWHIFLNAGEQKASGEIAIAQILISELEGQENERKKAQSLADSLYSLLENGEDFATLAKIYSHDRTSFSNGGIIPLFGVGKYERVFEEKAFSLKSDGDMLPPFETEYGFHILKRLSATAVPETLEAAYRARLTGQVSKDSRMELAKEAFSKKIMQATGGVPTSFDRNILWRVTDSALLASRIIAVGNLNENTALLRFNDKSLVRVKDWTQYLRNSQISFAENNHNPYPALFDQFTKAEALNNYRKRLATFNPDFNSRLQEFIEGNLLFEVMEREVWGKAAADTMGLKNHYNKHRDKYRWTESAEVLIFSCKNEAIAQKVRKDLENNINQLTLLEQYSGLLQIDSGRYETSQIPLNGNEKLIVNKITQPIVGAEDGTIVFVKTLALYPGNLQRSFEEARGTVTSDYQNLLEKSWLAALKQQYPVTLNEKVYNSL